jgi:hypothetical protein
MAMKTADKQFNLIFVSRPSETPEELNAFAIGHVGASTELAKQLGLELKEVTLIARTTSGDFVQVRLERAT